MATPAIAVPRKQAASSSRLKGWLTSGLAWSVVASTIAVAFVFGPLGGQAYYSTPLETRAYSDGHFLLRPSGPIGQSAGMLGALLMMMPFLYMARKKVPWLKSVGTLRGWLEVHLFCGITGPVLVTLHTSFKFNGLISAAYWSMITVMLSGFIGRYLFVRIPRSIRGTELTRGELDARAESLRVAVADQVQSMALLQRVDAFEREVVPDSTHLSWGNLFSGEIRLKGQLRRFRRELIDGGLDPVLAFEVVALTSERATLLRRVAYLQKTKTLFGIWHVFHLPLVYLLLVILIVHVGITLYLGYIPFRWG